MFLVIFNASKIVYTYLIGKLVTVVTYYVDNF